MDMMCVKIQLAYFLEISDDEWFSHAELLEQL
jgi:hypothetical protein